MKKYLFGGAAVLTGLYLFAAAANSQSILPGESSGIPTNWPEYLVGNPVESGMNGPQYPQWVMPQNQSGSQGNINQYIDRHGYENLYADYQYWMGEARRQGIPTSTYSFELYVEHRMLTEAGVDVAAMQQQHIAGAQRDMHNRQLATIGELNGGYDNYNEGWWENQGRQDRSMSDFSAGYRGEWAYADPYSGDSVTLPTAPNYGETYTDSYGNLYRNDEYTWYQVDPGSGYEVEMEELTHMPE